MTRCPLCGYDHPPGSPHMVFDTPITQVFGVDLWEPEPDTQPSEDVTALLTDYQRLREKEDRAREAKAAEMRRYRHKRSALHAT